jgi:hypothetical protein
VIVSLFFYKKSEIFDPCFFFFGVKYLKVIFYHNSNFLKIVCAHSILHYFNRFITISIKSYCY